MCGEVLPIMSAYLFGYISTKGLDRRWALQSKHEFMALLLTL